MARTNTQSWADRSRNVFSELERTEGERLFKDGAVTLVSATARKIVAHVDDENADEVVIETTRGSGVRAECACPTWERAAPCRHLWAAILAADTHMNPKAKARSVPRKPTFGAPAVPQGEPPVWRDLLFPSTPESPVQAVGIDFVVQYEVRIASNAVWLGAFKRRLLKSGKLGQLLKIGQGLLRDTALAFRDRSILGFIQGARLNEMYLQRGYVYDAHGLGFENYRPDVMALTYLLPELAATGRCSLVMDDEVVCQALRPSGTARLEWTGDGSGARTYEARIRVLDRVMAFHDVPLFFSTRPVMFFHGGLLHLFPDVGYDWVTTMRRRKGKVRVPKAEMRELVRATLDEASPPPIDIPAEFMPAARVATEITPCLELTVDKIHVWSRAWFDYGGFEVAHDDPRAQILDTTSWTRFERDQDRESELMARIEDLGLIPNDGSPMDLATVWDRLEQLGDRGWIMRGRDKRRIHGGRVGAIRVSSGKDWFELKGGVDFGDVVVPLPVAVRAYLRGERLVDLGNGETGLLPRDWLARHARMLEMGDKGGAKDGALHFHSAHAQFLDELLEACPDQPRDFLELRQKFKDFNGVTPPAPPRAFIGALRPYQHEALGWFDFLASFGFGGVLADDMGLGKTIQALAWMVLGRERGVGGPSLVVAPTSLLFNWRDEAARFAPDLRVLTYAGSDRAGLEEHFQDHDLILTTYGLLRRDVEILRAVTWRCAILDES